MADTVSEPANSELINSESDSLCQCAMFSLGPNFPQLVKEFKKILISPSYLFDVQSKCKIEI